MPVLLQNKDMLQIHTTRLESTIETYKMKNTYLFCLAGIVRKTAGISTSGWRRGGIRLLRW